MIIFKICYSTYRGSYVVRQLVLLSLLIHIGYLVLAVLKHSNNFVFHVLDKNDGVCLQTL